jgi:Kef-type K+ transport system membrane component KefB
MELIITLIICILVSVLFTFLARKLQLPAVVGFIIAGIIIGSPFLKSAILDPNTEFILNLGYLGLIFLMFIAGLEVSWSMMYRERKDALYVASFAAITPFLLGFVIFSVLGFPLLVSLSIGICVSITAQATNAEILIELKKLKTKLGSLMLGAGITDDVIGLSLFFLAGYFFTKTLAGEEIIVLLGSILAFFIGISVHLLIGREKHIMPYLEKFLLIFVIPFFFISMGMHFTFQSVAFNPTILILIIAIAISGKILGTIFTRPLTKLKFKQLYLVGWGMNSRGAVELAIAFVAFKAGLLDSNIYSSLVIMALVTTLIFPFFVRRMIKKEPHLME